MNKFVLACLLLTIIFFPGKAVAHLAGQAPYFKINDVYSNLYPVAVTTLSDIEMPQDLAADTYLVNEPVAFSLDMQQLPFPKEITDTMTFSWEYGDGEKGTGESNTHTYTKMGSYILMIYTDYTDTTGKKYPTQLLQSVLIHIVPDKKYVLPRAFMSVNGKTIVDPITDVSTFSPKEEVLLDAQKSIPGSSQITDYTWDLSDGETAKGKIVKHVFQGERNYVFPFLRIKTKDGFIADNYAEIGSTELNKTAENKTNVKEASTFSLPVLIGILIGINGVIITIFLLLSKRKK